MKGRGNKVGLIWDFKIVYLTIGTFLASLSGFSAHQNKIKQQWRHCAGKTKAQLSWKPNDCLKYHLLRRLNLGRDDLGRRPAGKQTRWPRWDGEVGRSEFWLLSSTLEIDKTKKNVREGKREERKEKRKEKKNHLHAVSFSRFAAGAETWTQT